MNWAMGRFDRKQRGQTQPTDVVGGHTVMDDSLMSLESAGQERFVLPGILDALREPILVHPDERDRYHEITAWFEPRGASVEPDGMAEHLVGYWHRKDWFDYSQDGGLSESRGQFRARLFKGADIRNTRRTEGQWTSPFYLRNGEHTRLEFSGVVLMGIGFVWGAVYGHSRVLKWGPRYRPWIPLAMRYWYGDDLRNTEGGRESAKFQGSLRHIYSKALHILSGRPRRCLFRPWSISRFVVELEMYPYGVTVWGPPEPVTEPP